MDGFKDRGIYTTVTIYLPTQIKKDLGSLLLEAKGNYPTLGSFIEYEIDDFMKEGKESGEPLWTQYTEGVVKHQVQVAQEHRFHLLKKGYSNPNNTIRWMVQSYLKEANDVFQAKKERDRKLREERKKNPPSPPTPSDPHRPSGMHGDYFSKESFIEFCERMAREGKDLDGRPLSGK